MCAAARGLISVWADGQIAPCAMFPKAGGSFRDASILDIWTRSPLFVEVRTKQMKDMTTCGTCGVRSTCTPCMAYALVEHDDIHACNSSSLQYATARHELGQAIVRADAKSARGRALPLVGDVEIERKASTGRLFTEQG
jgi:radical SAM protein with 4Fe4S-binding SPASM domain